MIARKQAVDTLRIALAAHYPLVALLGPRQCGKTTLARELHKQQTGHYFNLKDVDKPLTEDSLKSLQGLIIVDEFQEQPQLLKSIQRLANRHSRSAHFLIVGSTAPELIKGIAEALIGKTAYIYITGCTIDEVGRNNLNTLWLRGGLPQSLLPGEDAVSFSWRERFIMDFLERDIPQLGLRVPGTTLRRFWSLIAHLQGQPWNTSDACRSFDLQPRYVQKYLGILKGTYMIRQLQPWQENNGKRLVKAPKLYLRDSGLLHALLNIPSQEALCGHAKLEASWEGFVIESIIAQTGAEKRAYYYKTHAGAELDLLIIHKGKRYGFEIRYNDNPSTSKSMHVALADLQLTKLFIITPGTRLYLLRDTIEVVPLQLWRREMLEASAR